MSAPDAGILALPAEHWPMAPDAQTMTFRHQTAAVTTEADGATTYRFEAIDLVLRLHYDDDPDLVRVILDSVDTDRPPPPSPDGPDFDEGLGSRIAADLHAAAPPGPQVDTSSFDGSGGGQNPTVLAPTTAYVSAHLYRPPHNFEEEVARMIPSNCPPLTETFTDDCGQLVNVNGRRIAIVMPNDSYYHALVEAPDGHILNVIVHGADSPDALTVEDAIGWLTDAHALFGS